MSTITPPSISPPPAPDQRLFALPVSPMPPRPARNCDPWRGAALAAIKTAHSLIFFAEELSVGYLLYAGLTKRQGRATALAAAAVVAECVIFFGNGRRCPLTGVAEKLGAERGSVTDIYLPRWIAARIFTYNAPLVVVAALLHARVFLEEPAPFLSHLAQVRPAFSALASASMRALAIRIPTSGWSRFTSATLVTACPSTSVQCSAPTE